MHEPDRGDLRRVIGFWGGTALIDGITIGSGIFRKPYTLARDVGDPLVILAFWAGFGLVSLCGALALAELSSLLPRTGGVYVYLRAAYGDAVAFVFGWLYLLVTTPATIGALATFFTELLLGFLGRPPGSLPPAVPSVLAAGVIALLAAANLLGARFGTAIQGLFTLVKVAALAALTLACFATATGSLGNLAPSGRAVGWAALGSGAASVIWAYDGWIAVSMIAGEVVAPERLMKRIIIAGILAIVVLYVAANVGYFYAMPVDRMVSGGPDVPQRIVASLVGPAGATVLGACIMASVFGALNGNVLAKPRVVYAMARDGLTFGFLGRAHPRWGTPAAAILLQAGMAVALVFILRDFDALTTYFVVVEWFALLFAVGAVFVLRRRMPEAPRPFRTPGYPWVPLFFLAGTTAGLAAIVASELTAGRTAPLVGLGIALAGFPVYALWKRRPG